MDGNFDDFDTEIQSDEIMVPDDETGKFVSCGDCENCPFYYYCEVHLI